MPRGSRLGGGELRQGARATASASRSRPAARLTRSTASAASTIERPVLRATGPASPTSARAAVDHKPVGQRRSTPRATRASSSAFVASAAAAATSVGQGGVARDQSRRRSNWPGLVR